MKTRNLLFAGIIVYMLCSSTCRKTNGCPENSHPTVEIINNSNIAVNWMRDNNPSDTVWTVNGAFLEVSDRLVLPNSNNRLNAGLDYCWEYSYQNNYSNHFYFFNHDTVQALGWQGISGTNRGQLKRIKVDLNYLQANNFTITYP